MSKFDSVVESAASVTAVVQAAMSGTENPRLRQIMDALVEHSHAFVRAVQLTDQEFEQGLDFIRAVGLACNDRHNEVVLLADVLGISTLVTLQNNARDDGCTPGALLGPFYRDGSPEYPDGACIACPGTPGAPLAVTGRVLNARREPIAGAAVDVWQASPLGLYENQDPAQPDRNLRGRFHTDANGYFHFRSVRPAGYPVPTDGPVGRLLGAQRRHPYRPAHLHFVVVAQGHATLVAQVFADDSDHLASDVVFGVNRQLIGTFVRHDDEQEPGTIDQPYYTLDYEFVVPDGVASYPTAPIK